MSMGFGKWFARIGHDSVRELPYSLVTDGTTVHIVGYAYTSTGTQEPTVGTDWYPVNLDQYENTDYASVDAYIASEDGQATLQGCGVSALVPLETAVARLADNDINITVIEPVALYNRTDNSSGNTYLVVSSGGLADLEENSQPYAFQLDTQTGYYINPDMRLLPNPVKGWGLDRIGEWTHGQTKVVTVNGVTYTFTPVGDAYSLTPAAGTFGQ